MKKKGLIISTAVMVVVLIAALTTGTFAWFSQSADVAISEFKLTTTVSKGLQIATYYLETGDVFNYTSGNISKTQIGESAGTNGYYWGNGDIADFGSTLTIADATISGMYGASGNGLKLFKNSDDNKLTSEHPESFIAALPNENYYQIDFALMSTDKADASGTIYVKELTVTPSSDKGGMAGSARIALFVTSTKPTDTTSHFATFSETKDDTWKFLYDPYGDRKYNSGIWSTDSAPGNKYATKAGDYDEAVAEGTDLKTLWGSQYIVGDVDATENNGPATYTRTFTDVTGNPFGAIATVNGGDIVYLRLVIWFDGEDNACNQVFAGGGLDVKFNFGLKYDE